MLLDWVSSLVLTQSAGRGLIECGMAPFQGILARNRVNRGHDIP